MNPRAAILARVSSARQVEQGHSLEEQEDRLRRHAEAEGWPVVEVYREAGVSVTKGRKRPELERLLADAAAGRFTVFLTVAADRVGRSMAESLRVFETLDEARVRILSVTTGGVQDLSKDAPGSTAIRGALTLGAQLEADQIRDRARAGAAAKIQRGAYVGGQRPLGYLQPPGEGLQPHPSEAPLVREVFERYAEGESLRAIAMDLEARGVRRPNGGLWSASRVAELLDHGLYHGEVAPGKTGRHEPLIEDGLWERVRSLRQAKAKLQPQGGRHPRRHLLIGGMLVCGHCGHSFYARAYQHTTDSYRCRGRDGMNGPKTDCNMPPVPRELVDGAVRRIAARIDLSTEDADARVKARAEQAKKDARAAAAEVAKYERRLRHLRDEFHDEAISRAEYTETRAEYETDLTAARARQAGAEALARDLQANGHDHADAIRAAREFAANERPSDDELARYRAWLEAHFESFTLHVRPREEDETDAALARRAGELDFPESSYFTWKPQGRPEQIGTLIADWRPEVEARFSLEAGEQPRADASGLLS
jgi:site-specific DNA recombinase